MQNDGITEHRTLTLDIYRRLKQTLNDANKTIPESLATSAANLEQNRFLLAILGKVKAGKSTFINALLKCDLLPTDSLQATSAIIEVFHSQTPSLTVTFADGHVETTTSCHETFDTLKRKLKDVASIKADYRDLPTAQLDNFIIDRYNSESGQAEWDDRILEYFLHNDLPNIHHLSDKELYKRSIEYLKHNKTGSAVPKQIEVGYPSEHKLEHFRIVDTPGLCAKGGFASRTHQFLNRADAVIYLHKEEPAEETLHNALQNVIPEKTKKNMLLVVTHKSDRSHKANNDYLAEAIKCCPQVQTTNIFIVDSLTEIVLQTLYGKDHNTIKQICLSNDEWKKCTASLILDADGDVPKLLDLLEDQSNMRSLRNRFAHITEQSQRHHIQTVLDFLSELYKELEVEAIAHRDLYPPLLQNPQTFAAEMKNQGDAIDEIEAKLKHGLEVLSFDFDLGSPKHELGQRLKKLVSDIQSEVNGKVFNSSDTARTADDYLTKLDQDVHDSFCDLKKEIADRFRKMIVSLELTIQTQIDITVPKIALPELLNQIREETTETHVRDVDKPGFWNAFVRFITIGHCGKDQVTYRELNATRYFGDCKTAFNTSLEAKSSSFIEEVKTKALQACESYSSMMRDKLNSRRELIKELQQKEAANEDIQREFAAESANVIRIQNELEQCQIIRGKL